MQFIKGQPSQRTRVQISFPVSSVIAPRDGEGTERVRKSRPDHLIFSQAYVLRVLPRILVTFLIKCDTDFIARPVGSLAAARNKGQIFWLTILFHKIDRLICLTFQLDGTVEGGGKRGI